VTHGKPNPVIVSVSMLTAEEEVAAAPVVCRCAGRGRQAQEGREAEQEVMDGRGCFAARPFAHAPPRWAFLCHARHNSIIASMIRLMVGLGNPGAEYEATRHNAGFWFIDEVARQAQGLLAPERRYFGLAHASQPDGGPLWLLEPMTFMNLSGKSVAALARFFKIAPEEILVAHDELDLLPGQVKLKLGGSHAGHNGLKDIQAQLGSPDFWRLRLGIGHPGVKAEVVNYVLRKPPLADIGRRSTDPSRRHWAALDLMLAGDMERAMMKIHAKPPRPKPPRPEPTP
jgi:PTH1 family peptidyl-tRNA hydrolase